jgi:hypothetical protein
MREGACAWMVVDRDAGLGVCDACPKALPRWQAGDRVRADDRT